MAEEAFKEAAWLSGQDLALLARLENWCIISISLCIFSHFWEAKKILFREVSMRDLVRNGARAPNDLVRNQKEADGQAVYLGVLVGVARFELATSSVSGKRSPPELNARICSAAWGLQRKKLYANSPIDATENPNYSTECPTSSGNHCRRPLPLVAPALAYVDPGHGTGIALELLAGEPNRGVGAPARGEDGLETA